MSTTATDYQVHYDEEMGREDEDEKNQKCVRMRMRKIRKAGPSLSIFWWSSSDKYQHSLMN